MYNFLEVWDTIFVTNQYNVEGKWIGNVSGEIFRKRNLGGTVWHITAVTKVVLQTAQTMQKMWMEATRVRTSIPTKQVTRQAIAQLTKQAIKPAIRAQTRQTTSQTTRWQTEQPILQKIAIISTFFCIVAYDSRKQMVEISSIICFSIFLLCDRNIVYRKKELEIYA